MDEYLSEKEQIEEIKAWWRENGWYLVGGAVIAGLGYFGYGRYLQYQDQRAEAAAVVYLELQQVLQDDRTGTDELLQQLASEYSGSPYTDQARLLVAQDSLIRDPARTVEELRIVMDTSEDPGLAMIARLRLARALAYQENFDEALAVLNVEDAGDFTARISEITGDVQVARGELDAARVAYTQALTERGSEAIDRNFVQMKLGDLNVATPVAEPAEGGA